MANFSIDGRLKNAPDVQRTFLFELVIPANFGGKDYDKDLIYRVKTAVIPSRAVEVIESNYMGMKQYFPGRSLFNHNLSVNIEEHEDQGATKFLYDWQQQIFDVNPTSPTAGQSKSTDKKSNQYAKDISLYMYKYNGEKLGKKIMFYNSFVESVADYPLSYTSDSVKYDVTFRFDYWLLKDA
jgi:hypothetical protein